MFKIGNLRYRCVVLCHFPSNRPLRFGVPTLLFAALLLTSCSPAADVVGLTDSQHQPVAVDVPPPSDEAPSESSGGSVRDTANAVDNNVPSVRTRPVANVPNVRGMTETDAVAMLESSGLNVTIATWDETINVVSSQWPPAGRPTPIDNTVQLRFGEAPQTPEPTEPPTEPEQLVAEATQTVTENGDATPPADNDQSIAASQYAVPATVVTPPPPVTVPTTGSTSSGPNPVTGRTSPRNIAAVPIGTEFAGRASWYGPGFHGNRTACGTVFDMNAATIASRELRCGTVVRITGPRGTTEATVTDWGPAEWTGRRFDLSRAVFQAVADINSGVTDVTVVTQNEPQ